ncbi:MAG: hypothetical protein WAW03_02345 [Anaerolineae bacterium]|jgi:hypothetical protein|uniref:hypothetical protein n=1 Tax=Candidatus Amarolinea dominans TaxID=3140696 RepID=UPI001D875CCF|nr:hypothetical protein [Anaerolineae bacterium]MBK7202174.1 hypothetical protein [Anaerolineae bacterium]MBK9092941.1 hypothetical protein [Anaerolineae bacterium]MBK9230954.1 hypothetical protein [Anaerolineae bacterium]
MPTRIDCRYYYEDYHRGRDVQECRLPQSRESAAWNPNVCNSCPVPGILRATNTRHLALEGTIKSRFLLGNRMTVFAICTRHKQQLSDPRVCPACASESA